MKKLLISVLLPRGLRFKTRGFNSSYLSAYGPVMTLLFPSPSQRYRQLVMNPNMLLWLHDAAGKVDHEGFAARLVKFSNYYSPPLHIRGEYFLHYFRLQGSIQWKIYTPVRLLDALHVKLRGWKARNKLSKFTMVSISIRGARLLSPLSSPGRVQCENYSWNYFYDRPLCRGRAKLNMASRQQLATSASNEGYPKVRNHKIGAFSWLKVATTAFTFDTIKTNRCWPHGK